MQAVTKNETLNYNLLPCCYCHPAQRQAKAQVQEGPHSHLLDLSCAAVQQVVLLLATAGAGTSLPALASTAPQPLLAIAGPVLHLHASALLQPISASLLP